MAHARRAADRAQRGQRIMNLLDVISGEKNGAVVQQMARQLGIGEGDTRKAMGQMLPALARGLQRNASQSGGLDQLLGALGSGGHDRYLSNPEQLGRPESITDGNAILAHILGTKDVSRNVAGRAAKQTGLDAGILKKMLPMLAAAAMGALGSQTRSGGSLGGLQGSTSHSQGASALDTLSSFLDADKDGSMVDDVLNIAQKFF
jgi:hypothetical protein